jgi:thiol-disulfide isomerase/thioredoxin
MTHAELNQLITNKKGNSLLFFTAAWCGHCKTMLPTLNRLYHRFHDQGLRFIAIIIDAGGPAAMERVLEKKPVDFSVFWVGETVVDEFRLVGIPMIFLVKNGQIVEKIPGKCSYEFLQGKILDFIK